MAEFFAIVGSISAIIDLISFARNIISVAGELKDPAGELQNNNERDSIVTDLEAILGNLRLLDSDDDDDDKSFESLRQNALLIAIEFRTALSKLKIEEHSSRWQSAKVAIRNVWDKKKVKELDARLKGLTLELNTHLTANSNRLLNEISNGEQQHFEALQTDAKNLRSQIDDQTDAIMVELNKQSLQMRESSTKPVESLTAKLDLINKATSRFSTQMDDLKNQLEVLKLSDEKHQIVLENLLETAKNLQLQSSLAESQVKAVATGSRTSKKKFSTAENSLQACFDMFAQYNYQRVQLKQIEAAKGQDSTQVSTTGHTYSGPSILREEGIHIRGNLGISNQRIEERPKHLYSGKTDVAGKAIAIDGEVYDATFLPFNMR